MAIQSVQVDENAKTLTIVMDLDPEGKPSKSGKTMVHASTLGNKPVAEQVRGQALVIGVNAYTPR